MGQPAYLEPKGRGDNSMPVKRRTDEGVYAVAPQDPRRMVKAKLLQIQFPVGLLPDPLLQRLRATLLHAQSSMVPLSNFREENGAQ